MKKSDLKTGMVVKLRDGDNYVVMIRDNEQWITSDESWDSLNSYNDDLTCDYDNDYDIVKVYEPTAYTLKYIYNVDATGEVLYERTDRKKK